ncbi:MAG TPA: Glu/Leu/Phe/Val dehydrogenase dimerization domain-containing protein [Planctomycetota bacterium]|jgi:leucine dehydrogenase|nr:Glu/Leu/Phe/Val dehydrogenase dimerization domain-containing protein [Planctomycetota bacterium]HJM38538.1 Glu/Leu/Phe/Val dehydrogenase dimerization domain-containing protein [Planctomycetota bacterium]|tara:strand:- start:22494 stop:23564 length:1071 start_codon:yes stop_codon:yes gene_type:complete
MELLDWMARGGHERVLAVQDSESGLSGWIALHNTRRGPAYGGIRMWRYRNEAEAALDALRLSQSMTYKCVLAGIAGGGAKTVIFADRIKNRPLAMEKLGGFIEGLGGVYRCGPDVGFVESDRLALQKGTTHYACHSQELRPAGEATAEGVEYGMRAALDFLDGNSELKGKKVAIQGLGSVGLPLAKRLLDNDCEVFGCDLNANVVNAAEGLGVKIVEPAKVFEVESDIFAPCAMGGVLHDLNLQRLRSRIVAGAANNVLPSPEQADQLRERGVLYVPDFVLNSGALIEGAGFEQTGRKNYETELRRIGATVSAVFQRADAASCSTHDAATGMARDILVQENQIIEQESPLKEFAQE